MEGHRKFEREKLTCRPARSKSEEAHATQQVKERAATVDYATFLFMANAVQRTDNVQWLVDRLWRMNAHVGRHFADQGLHRHDTVKHRWHEWTRIWQ
jgi:hypothetical protein